MELSKIGLKVYKINSTKLNEVYDYFDKQKPKAYSKIKELLISYKKFSLDSVSNQQSKLTSLYEKDKSYEIHMDMKFHFKNRVGDHEDIMTRIYYLVFREIESTVYMFVFMSKHLITFFENSLKEHF